LRSRIFCFFKVAFALAVVAGTDRTTGHYFNLMPVSTPLLNVSTV
jgi:hypothetical protein